MKLYSRGQVICFSFISALLVALVALGIGLWRFSPSGGGAAAQDAAFSGAAETARSAGDVIRELNQVSVPLQINTAELAGFSESERINIAIYEQLNAGVVNITTETVAINWFLEPVPQAGSSGSGSIITDRGHVLTNYHVIRNANRVYITLASGEQFEGIVEGTDPENDLAVLRFNPPQGMDLRVIPFGNSENLRVGQKVLAIGNPFALERTLTVGIVSGLGRPIQTSSRHIIRNMIQTDASINPGNSGGPLLNAQGQMIGINTVIYSPTGGSVGIGFAVPVDTAMRVVAEIIAHGRVQRGWIDATVVQIFPALVRHANLPVNSGFLVSRTRRNGLAERAGLRQGNEPVQHGRNIIYLGGDIITAVNGIRTNNLADLYSALEGSRPGDVVSVEIIRAGRAVTLSVPLADREEVLAR
ncbi:MAG: trypsin-like peptidase domain-containing protein [Treponema sp.]|nr:trypsin-like peptidase domain-containing protein [Treponema sp.]